jgi:hypothetical protein
MAFHSLAHNWPKIFEPILAGKGARAAVADHASASIGIKAIFRLSPEI